LDSSSGWIPLIGILFGLVIGILAIIFSSIGLSRSGRMPGQVGKGMAITGLVLGILIVIFKLIPGGQSALNRSLARATRVARSPDHTPSAQNRCKIVEFPQFSIRDDRETRRPEIRG
jgi:hypothetical protein